MKQYIFALTILVTMSACNGQSSGYKEAKKMEKAIKEAPKPGAVETKSGGWTMTARVNGKPWTATSVMPPAVAGPMVGYVGDDSYIMMYSFEKKSARVGKPVKLGDGYSVDYWIKDGQVYSNYTGTMEITAINGNWVEGKFEFTAAGLKVTDGFYRVEL
jgi:hypothetical protein